MLHISEKYIKSFFRNFPFKYSFLWNMKDGISLFTFVFEIHISENEKTLIFKGRFTF
jgi:hypothetical protein